MFPVAVMTRVSIPLSPHLAPVQTLVGGRSTCTNGTFEERCAPVRQDFGLKVTFALFLPDIILAPVFLAQKQN